jgi:hypothetical protein
LSDEKESYKNGKFFTGSTSIVRLQYNTHEEKREKLAFLLFRFMVLG